MKIGIFGAGQTGFTLVDNLSSGSEVVAWFDNDESKWGKEINGVKVEDPETIRVNKWGIEMIYIASLNFEASLAIETQIENYGYKGEIRQAVYFKQIYDMRRGTIRRYAKYIEMKGVPGELAELGVYRGDLSREMARLFPDRRLFLFDTFNGFDNKDLRNEAEQKQASLMDFSETSIDIVMENMPNPQRVVICQGYFPETIPKEEITYAMVSLDPDLYQPVLSGLRYFYPRLSVGGVIIIHDYSSSQFPGVRQAVDEYCGENNLFVLPLCDFHGTAVLIKNSPQK